MATKIIFLYSLEAIFLHNITHMFAKFTQKKLIFFRFGVVEKVLGYSSYYSIIKFPYLDIGST